MPAPKYFEEFDWNFNPKIPKQLILDLATLRFVPEPGGALILGAVLGDNVAAGVLLDRFRHHAEIVQLRGRSYLDP